LLVCGMVSVRSAALLSCCWVSTGLKDLGQVQLSNGVFNISLSSIPFGDFGFNTFGINGQVPGPSIRVQAGETVTIELSNGLDPADGIPCSDTSRFCDCMFTNVHLHGMHLSSKGVLDSRSLDGDDITVKLSAGESMLYQHFIPENHMPGTHWYHPHHHHATALQAGGGAAGFFIVEDPPDFLPEVFMTMPEVLWFISTHNLDALQRMADEAQTTTLRNASTIAAAKGLSTNPILVNGELMPTVDLPSHTWHRMRIVYASIEQSLRLVTDSSSGGTCALQLLAKDGIYLDTIPRSITAIHLFPGARVDVAWSCSCASYPCSVVVKSVPNPQPAGGGNGNGNGNGGFAGGDIGNVNLTESDIMTITIADSQTSASPELPVFNPARPCYLTDVRDADVAGSGVLGLQSGQGTFKVTWNGAGESMTEANIERNGGDLRTWPALASWDVGSVYEVQVSGINAHPLHFHVNPYQIVDMPEVSYGDGFFKIGDFHDTLLLSDLTGSDPIKIRMVTDRFAGKMFVHCHILAHEDMGMMNVIDLIGTEGALFTGSSSCFNKAFDASSDQGASFPEPAASVSKTVDSGFRGLAIILLVAFGCVPW